MVNNDHHFTHIQSASATNGQSGTTDVLPGVNDIRKSLREGPKEYYTVRRDHIIEDLVKIYGKDNENGDGTTGNIAFEIEGEEGIDNGGVAREVFSFIWKAFYIKCCEGQSQYIPIQTTAHATDDFYFTCGRIFHHEFLV